MIENAVAERHDEERSEMCKEKAVYVVRSSGS